MRRGIICILASLAATTHADRCAPWVAAQGTYRVRALASRFSNGEIAFAITPYVFGAGHQLIETVLLSNQQEANSIVDQWGGELEINNNTLLAGNVTSGYLREQGRVSNPEVLREFLASKEHPFLVSPRFQIESYDPERRHLDPRLNEVLALTHARLDQSFMHQIRNVLTPFANGLFGIERSFATDSQPDFIPLALQNEALGNVPPQYWKILDIYLSVLADESRPFEGRALLPEIVGKITGRTSPLSAAEFRTLQRLENFFLEANQIARDRKGNWSERSRHLVRRFPLVTSAPLTAATPGSTLLVKPWSPE